MKGRTDMNDSTPTEANEGVAVPNLSGAVCAVMKDVKRLQKKDRNKFASYDYVSVDDHKDALRPIIAENGLEICLDQTGLKKFEATNDKGKVTVCFIYKFKAWLKHGPSGEAGKREGIDVPLPYTGAQTCGAARSYAIKEYMKTKFLQSGGDQSDDADSGPAGEVAELSKADAREPYEKLQREVREIADKGSLGDLDLWVKRNEVMLAALPSSWKTLMQNEWHQSDLQIRARMKTAEVNEKLPDLSGWFEGFESQLCTATTLSDLEEVWIEHEQTIEAMIATEKATANRLFKTAKEKLNGQ